MGIKNILKKYKKPLLYGILTTSIVLSMGLIIYTQREKTVVKPIKQDEPLALDITIDETPSIEAPEVEEPEASEPEEPVTPEVEEIPWIEKEYECLYSFLGTGAVPENQLEQYHLDSLKTVKFSYPSTYTLNERGFNDNNKYYCFFELTSADGQIMRLSFSERGEFGLDIIENTYSVINASRGFGRGQAYLSKDDDRMLNVYFETKSDSETHACTHSYAPDYTDPEGRMCFTEGTDKTGFYEISIDGNPTKEFDGIALSVKVEPYSDDY